MAPRKLSKENLQLLKKKLLQRKTYLIGEFNSRMNEASASHENRLTDLMDIASDSFDDEMAMSMASQEREELVAIDEALGSMKEGKYGVCNMCGRSIGMKRLEVVPFSNLCIGCKREQEVAGNHGGGES